MKKLLVILLVVLLAAGGYVGWKYISGDWVKTLCEGDSCVEEGVADEELSENSVYKSSLYGFEFTYPSDRQLDTVGMENLTYGDEMFGIQLYDSNGDEAFVINLLLFPEGSTIGGVYESEIRPLFEEGNILEIAEMAYSVNESNAVEGVNEINIGGQIGYQFVLEGGENFGFTEASGGRLLNGVEQIIYISDGMNLYKITLISDSDFAQEIIQTLMFAEN